ncbi:hypothetical protein BU15DRAFT_83037 [Melanogaster broomeanus]|nr:hypothetical protein BU15DRAFT_83037 [Melanogaster broomeanus]
MRSFAALPSVVLLATSAASASSFFSIPLMKFECTGSYLKGSPDRDRARASYIKSHSTSRTTTVPVSNLAYAQYTTSVGIGSTTTSSSTRGPPTPAAAPALPIPARPLNFPIGETVNVTYGLGYFSEIEYLDQVILAPIFRITNQSICDAFSYADFEGVEASTGTPFPDANGPIRTTLSNLVSQGVIKDEVLGVYFAAARATATPASRCSRLV